jgi:sulfide:quinone oxidoreductase
VLTGARDAQRITRDLRSLTKKGIEFLMGEIEGIDSGARLVTVAGSELSYDYLVIALGAQYSSDEIEGLGQSWTFYHLDGADGLNERLETLRAGRVAIVVSSLPYRCSTALYEGAFLLDDLFRRRKVRRAVEITVYTPEARPVPEAGPQVSDHIAALLTERNIGFTPGVRLAQVDQRARQVRFEDGSPAAFDLLIATPIHRCPAVLRECGLTGASGWVEVDAQTLAAAFEDVYAIGDVNLVRLSDGSALPKTGVFAHGQAEVVARDIAAKVAGSDPIWAFGGQGSWFMSTAANRAAQITGKFYPEAGPDVRMRGPNRRWHWAKVGYERLWLWRWF